MLHDSMAIMLERVKGKDVHIILSSGREFLSEVVDVSDDYVELRCALQHIRPAYVMLRMRDVAGFIMGDND